MLSLTMSRGANAHGPTRRELLRAGAASLLGVSLPSWLRAESARSAGKVAPAPKAKSLIFFFLEGGPAHQDLWDMKPDAPSGVRSEFKPIETTVPGLFFCEHLPMLAKQAHHLNFVRSCHHRINDHNAGAYFAMTGQEPLLGNQLVTRPRPDNFPPIGSVLAKLKPSAANLPNFVQTPDWMSNLGSFLPGQDAGFLGRSFDPFLTDDPSLPDYRIPGLHLPTGLTLDRVGQRRDLLNDLSRSLDENEKRFGQLDDHYRKAYSLIASPEARLAFDLSQEPAAVRERYGLDPGNDRKREARQFGGLPHLGQCLLLTRRLIEAGVRVVTVCTGARYDQAWDTHRNHFPLLKQSLLPMFDRGFSALLEDMDQRGLLDETLIVAVGEFGRTPRIGQITSNAGADKGGRDHWPSCYTAMFAGAGLPKGGIFGASDNHAAYPREMPVTPQDLIATIYTIMGIDPSTTIRDQTDRPRVVSDGQPIRALIG